MRLAKSEAAMAGDLAAALRELAEAAATTLQVERASVWLYDEGGTAIRCVELYEKTPHRHSGGAALAAADFPGYFKALEEERAIVAHDAHHDPRTREFSASYLAPLGITAMLDAPIRVRGRMAGVVCHEHVGEPRRWTLEEQTFAASLADLAALALEADERRRTEEKLREQGQILDHAYDAILIRDLDGRILFWNRGAQEAYGWSAEEARGRIIHDLMRTRFSRPLAEIEGEVLRTGRWEGELGYTCRDGREIVISSRWALLRGDRGEAAAILEIGRDVTERLRSEAALRESEERFRQVAENIDVVFFMTEWVGETGLRLLYVSSAYERIWGRTRESLYASPRDWVSAVHPDDREQVGRALPGAAAGDFDEEFRIVRPDGTVRWVHSRVFPVLDHKGEHHRNAGIVEDVTGRREAEEELRKAKEAAETASSAKDQFLATLSHELRTPLTPVLTLASGLQEDASLAPRVRQALDVIRRNVELEARLIDDLLDLTRIARGKLELHREVVDVRQLLAHSVEICCQPEVEAGRLRLLLDLGASEHRLWADAPRLTQVFWNLLKNAVKFTPDGGEIRIVSRDEEREDGEPDLLVEISDTGIGIDPRLLPRIFDAFEQTDRRITRRFGGLGLGLALSKAILEMHGGSLTAASPGPDQGSTFTVRLPGGGLPPAAEPIPTPAAVPAPGQDAELRLLLVEDHADTAEAMADLLRALGHRVTVAGSVASALAAAEADQGRFDLVISDLGLPDGSGLDLMRELSGRYRLRGVALSGYGMEEDVQRSRDAGFERHLTKPVNLQALKAVLRETAGSEG